MKKQPSLETLKKRRQAKLDRLRQVGPFVAGSLNRVERKGKHGKVSVYHLLTFKEQGRTRSIYVPKQMLKEVGSWIRNYKRLKKTMADVSTISISIIQRFVPEKRAAAQRSRGKPRSR